MLGIRWGFPPVLEQRFTVLDREHLVLGRGDDCDVVLTTREVSRRHAEIVAMGPIFVLRNLGSRNGVFVDGAPAEEVPLNVGQVLRLGDCVGVVALAGDAEAGRAAFSVFAQGMAGGPVLLPAVEMARRAAPSTLPVALVGATGTGKEGFARAVHLWSGRKRELVSVNCAAISPTLIEGELFGYRKGAFTGADRASPGYFRAADGGTLFLDELCDLPLAAQSKLLRVLEQREVVPLAETSPIPVDVRLIAAMQIPLRKAVEEGRLRPDLCARLDGVTIEIPSLKDRKQEIPYLFSYFLALHSGGQAQEVEARLVEQLCLYDWPFNVRELDHLVRRLLVLYGHEGLLRRAHLPPDLFQPSVSGVWQPSVSGSRDSSPPRTPAPNTPEAHRARREADRKALEAALVTEGGILARAARVAGLSRQRAHRLIGRREQDEGNGGATGTRKPGRR